MRNAALGLVLAAAGLLAVETSSASATVPNDDPATATTVPVALTGTSTATLTNVGATRSSDDPSFYGGTGDGSPDDASPCYGAASAWYQLHLPVAASGRVHLGFSTSSGFDAVLTVFKAQSATPGYTTLDAVTPVLPARSVRVGQTGNSGATLDFDADNDGRPYLIAVAGCNTDFGHDDAWPANTGTVTMTSTFYQRGSWDAFSSAAQLPSLTTVDVRQASAGHEADEPSSYDADESCTGGQSIWLRQDPPAGTVFVRTHDELFHGVLTLATGTPGAAVADLQVVDRAEFGAGAGQGLVHTQVTAGSRLWLRVEACNLAGVPLLPLGDLGTVELETTSAVAPANDDYADAPTLVGPNVVVSAQNEFATSEPGESPATVDSGSDSGESVWYRWTVPSTGRWSVDTATSPINTVLEVGHLVASVDQFVPDVAENDDAPVGDGTSRVAFRATAGTDLVVRVSGVEGATVNAQPSGAFRLWVKRVPDTTPPTVSIAAPSAGTTVAAGSRLRIAIKATDADSGVKKVVVSLPGDEERTITRQTGRAYQVTVTVGPRRRFVFSAYAVDDAGNQSTRVSRTVTVTP